MGPYLGDYKEDATLDFMWDSNKGDGSSVTRATDGTISVYKGNSTTQTTTGVTDDEDFDTVVGVHHTRIVLTDAFYATGNDYSVVLSAATIDGKTVNAVLAQFSIENRFAEVDVVKWLGSAPNALVSGRVDSSTGANAANVITAAAIAANAITSAKIATDAIGSAQIAANAIGASELASNAIGADQLAANAITAAKIATDAIGAAQLALDAVNEIRDSILTDATKFPGAAITEARLSELDAGTGGKMANQIDLIKPETDKIASIKTKTDSLAFTGGNVHSHTKVQDNLALTAQQKLDVNTEADTALTDFDPPTRAEATSDKNEIITEVDANETKIDTLQTDVNAVKAKTDLLAFTSGNVHSHTKVQDNLALTAQQKLDVNTEADTALTDFDPPTRAEATSDKNEIIVEVDANEVKIDAVKSETALIKTETDKIPSIKTETEKIANVNAGSGVSGSVIEEVENRATPAQVKTQSDLALTDLNLDHLLKVAAAAGDAVDSSIIARLASKSVTPSFASFNNQTDSLEAISDAATSGGFMASDRLDLKRVKAFTSPFLGGEKAIAYYVDGDSGNDSSDGFGWDTAFVTIAKATGLAIDGDVIFARRSASSGDANAFDEDVVIPKGVSLIGVTGGGGAAADRTHLRIRGLSTAGAATDPVLIINEGGQVKNCRIECEATNRTGSIVEMESGTCFHDFTLGGNSSTGLGQAIDMKGKIDTVGCFLRNGHVSGNNIPAGNRLIKVTGNDNRIIGMLLHDTLSNCIEINGGKLNLIQNNKFSNVPTGKFAVVLDATAERNRIVGNFKDGAGGMVDDTAGGIDNQVLSNGDNVDILPENVSGIPPKNPTVNEARMLTYMRRRNKQVLDSNTGEEQIFNDAGTKIHEGDVTDAAGIFTKQKLRAPT